MSKKKSDYSDWVGRVLGSNPMPWTFYYDYEDVPTKFVRDLCISLTVIKDWFQDHRLIVSSRT